ncbi:MAG: class I SAM-dependent methyltransferase [Solirubrobacteraceae bacterium]
MSRVYGGEMTDGRRMGAFWDARAREDALFFVDDRRAYGSEELESFWAGGERDLDAVLAAVGARVEPHEVVVDLGCGVGRLTRVLAGRARGVRAIDVSSEMLSRAGELNVHLANVEWILGDGLSLDGIGDESVDAVISHVVFQHIPDPTVTLGYVAEIGRVLRPGGWAAFQLSSDPHVHRRRPGVKRRVAAAVGRAPQGQDRPEWLGSAIDLDDLRAVARESAMTVAAIAHPNTQFSIVRLERP